MPTGTPPTATISGEIDITPPLIWKELQDMGITQGPGARDVVQVVITDVRTDTDYGYECRRSGNSITPIADGPLNTFYLLDQVQTIVDLLPSGKTLSGYLEVTEGPSPAVWRVYVLNGAATRVDPQIVWPA